jgi:hypothetical protein
MLNIWRHKLLKLDESYRNSPKKSTLIEGYKPSDTPTQKIDRLPPKPIHETRNVKTSTSINVLSLEAKRVFYQLIAINLSIFTDDIKAKRNLS